MVNIRINKLHEYRIPKIRTNIRINIRTNINGGTNIKLNTEYQKSIWWNRCVRIHVDLQFNTENGRLNLCSNRKWQKKKKLVLKIGISVLLNEE